MRQLFTYDCICNPDNRLNITMLSHQYGDSHNKDNDKTTEWGILFNQNPRRNHQAEGHWVSALVVFEGVLVEQNTERMWFLFYPVISWIYIFMGKIVVCILQPT